MVTSVPPACGPESGDTLVTVGAGGGGGVSNVNDCGRVADCPSGFITETSTVSGVAQAVVLKTNCVDEINVVTTSLFPTLTFAPFTKLAPIKVTVVPPVVRPLSGVRLVISGAGGAIYV
ncbi:hypothetical protein D3C77_430720 [compost metagenome]